MMRAICGYDPSALANSTFQAFKPIKMQTHCIFARHAAIWTSRDWDFSLSFDENMAANIPAFSLFASAQKRVDGFLFGIEGAGNSLEDHARTLKAVLQYLRYCTIIFAMCFFCSICHGLQ